MEIHDLQRHQLIRRFMAPPAVSVANASIILWEQMTSQIVSIVGEDGFNSLYARSIYLTQSTFPLVVGSPPSSQTGHRFAELKASLEGETPAQARDANSLLLITFTDILASLIGELLTTRILNLAWSTQTLNTTSKEIQND